VRCYSTDCQRASHTARCQKSRSSAAADSRNAIENTEHSTRGGTFGVERFIFSRNARIMRREVPFDEYFCGLTPLITLVRFTRTNLFHFLGKPMKFATTALLSVTLCATDAFAAQRTLKPFANEAELQAAFSALANTRRRHALESKVVADAALSQSAPVAAPAAPATAPPPAAKTALAAESVTNVQTAGVDEGGIVKTWGDYLVVLRRGRLFTVKIGGEVLTPTSMADAYGPGIDGRGAWYDEMLIHGNTIVIVGFSYTRGGTEIGLFEISRKGELRHKNTHHLRSNDYFSTRNYASRLVGSKLIFYTPLAINHWTRDLDGQLPGLRSGDAKAFKRIAPAERIYSMAKKFDENQTLHTITTCDLANATFDCESTGVLAPRSRSFYVSNNYVYIWSASSPQLRGRRSPFPERAASVFRMPLDGKAPSMLQTRDAPIDQLSFNEEADGTLNVLLRSDAHGDAMWGAERRSRAAFSLLRATKDSFGDETDIASENAYTPLPDLPLGSVQNRYIGDYLLYGIAHGYGSRAASDASTLVALRYASPKKLWQIALPHSVERIEALGRDALITGQDQNGKRALSMTSVELNKAPFVSHRFQLADAAQAESRTHGFFYKPVDAASGTIGLPILRDSSASVLFVANDALTLKPLGTLDSKAERTQRDNCVASCVDWYGNARPIFLRGRLFALMGYEIVEGRIDSGAIGEVRRVNYFQPTISWAK
jgi:Beta propeller domain